MTPRYLTGTWSVATASAVTGLLTGFLTVALLEIILALSVLFVWVGIHNTDDTTVFGVVIFGVLALWAFIPIGFIAGRLASQRTTYFLDLRRR
jgi:hypothetical protein